MFILLARARCMKTDRTVLTRPAMNEVGVRGKKTQDTAAMLRRPL